MTDNRDTLHYPPRGLSRPEAARYVGLGVSKFDELVDDGRMPKPLRVDRRVIWDRVELDIHFTELTRDTDNVLDDLIQRQS